MRRSTVQVCHGPDLFRSLASGRRDTGVKLVSVRITIRISDEVLPAAMTQARRRGQTLGQFIEPCGAIEISYEVGGGLDEDTRAARRAVKEAAEAQERAAEKSRAAARRLKARGLKGVEVAAVLGVSEQRVSQLLKPKASTKKTRGTRAKISA
ncbi:MAG: hypothetical protein ACRDJ9_35900 [Dehalococcoidia bacterium]